MFIIPEVLNTLLMGLVLLVIVIVLLRPAVLHFLAQQAQDDQDDLQKRAIEAVHQHLMRCAEASATQRLMQIRYQKLLLEVPEKTVPAESSLSAGQAVSQQEEMKATLRRQATPEEILNSAQSYEDKVGVVRWVGQDDQPRVASVIRDMIQRDDG